MRYCRDIKREAKIEFRVSGEEKRIIHDRARRAGLAVSEFMRRECLGRALGDGNAACKDSQAQAERVAGLTGASVPVAEHPEGKSVPLTREQFIETRRRMLYAQGQTTRSATTEAEREWREAHPDTEETE